MTDFHNSNIVLDEAEGYIDAAATYRIEACWSRRNHRGWRSVDYVSGVILDSWTFGKKKLTREMAVTLTSEEWVAGQEQSACDEWLKCAEQDDFDGYCDYRYDMAAE